MLEPTSLVLILLGPPGAGKGTAATVLTQELGFPHISTGELFRAHIRSQTPLGICAQKYIDRGHLVPDELTLDMLKERTERLDCKQGYILDGVPRTLPQAKALDQQLQDKRVMILYFNLPDGAILERLAGRVSCTLCGKPYHKKFDPPPLQCPCGGAIGQRPDDSESVILERLFVYRAQTAPVIAHYGKTLIEIDAGAPKSQVLQEIMSVAARFAPSQV